MKKLLLNVSIVVGLLAPLHSAKAEKHSIFDAIKNTVGFGQRMFATDKIPQYQDLINGLEKIKDGDKPFTRVKKDNTEAEFTVKKDDRAKLVDFAKASKELREKVGESCKEDDSAKEFWKNMDLCIAMGLGETFLKTKDDKRVERQDSEIKFLDRPMGQCFYELNEFLELKAKKADLSAVEKTFVEKLKETAKIFLAADLDTYKPTEDSKAKKALDKTDKAKVCKIEDKKEKEDRTKKEEDDKKAKEEKEKKDKEDKEKADKDKPGFKNEGSPATGKLGAAGEGAGGQPVPPNGATPPGGGAAVPPPGFNPTAQQFDPSANAGQNPFDALNNQFPFIQQPPQIDQSQRRDGDRAQGSRTNTENPPQQQQFQPPQDSGNDKQEQPLPPEQPQPPPPQPPIPVGDQTKSGLDPMMLALLQQMNQANNRPAQTPLPTGDTADAVATKARLAALEKANELGQGFRQFGQGMYNGMQSAVGPLLGSASGMARNGFASIGRQVGKFFNTRAVAGAGRTGSTQGFKGTAIFRSAPASSGDGVRGGLGRLN